MTLDDETRALLGYATQPLHEVELREAGALISDNLDALAVRNDRDIATREIDGRHRRNWRHKRKP